MKNAFFDLALSKAANLVSTRTRMILLLGKLATKLKNVNWKEIKSHNAKEKVFLFGRLLKAYVKGEYTSIPWKPLLFITAAVLYFINPVDLIPDWIVGLGFTDDISILMMVYTSVHAELNKFLEWERAQLPTVSLQP